MKDLSLLTRKELAALKETINHAMSKKASDSVTLIKQEV